MTELNRYTKRKDVLPAYPGLKLYPAEINPKFSHLNSPLGKVMMGRVTLSEISRKSGTDIDGPIEGSTKLI